MIASLHHKSMANILHRIGQFPPEGVRALDMPGGKFLITRGEKNIPEILPLEAEAPANKRMAGERCSDSSDSGRKCGVGG
jgi:hypothetical protein